MALFAVSAIFYRSLLLLCRLILIDIFFDSIRCGNFLFRLLHNCFNFLLSLYSSLLYRLFYFSCSLLHYRCRLLYLFCYSFFHFLSCLFHNRHCLLRRMFKPAGNSLHRFRGTLLLSTLRSLLFCIPKRRFNSEHRLRLCFLLHRCRRLCLYAFLCGRFLPYLCIFLRGSCRIRSSNLVRSCIHNFILILFLCTHSSFLLFK